MRIYIGWDWSEDEAWQVCAHSLRKHSSVPLDIRPLSSEHPLMTRPYYHKVNQMYDRLTESSFSTMFSYARFLVPILEDYRGWAMFIDCDFLFRRDVKELFDLREDDKAVMVVQHDHQPTEGLKMGGVIQTGYRRKNWSSMVLWNCGHRAHMLAGPFRGINTEKVNTMHPGWLHGFDWLELEQIGKLPSEWNWLEGHSNPEADPAGVHFTRGGPWLPGYENVAYADEWRAMHSEAFGTPSPNPHKKATQ